MMFCFARACCSPPSPRPPPRSAQQNVILFVADGLRAAAVSPERAPTFARIRDTGVNFANSHSLLPTITTANASVIATGHFLGDTGDFGNTLLHRLSGRERVRNRDAVHPGQPRC